MNGEIRLVIFVSLFIDTFNVWNDRELYVFLFLFLFPLSSSSSNMVSESYRS